MFGFIAKVLLLVIYKYFFHIMAILPVWMHIVYLDLVEHFMNILTEYP